MTRTFRTVLWLFAAPALIAAAFFVSRAGRAPATAGEWAGLGFGALLLVLGALSLGLVRTAARDL